LAAIIYGKAGTVAKKWAAEQADWMQVLPQQV
jgi:hypothetical protein